MFLTRMKRMLITFTFTVNQENNEVVFSGNIEPLPAMQILQQIVIGDALRKEKAKWQELEKSKRQEALEQS